jgi:hypothetical protein
MGSFESDAILLQFHCVYLGQSRNLERQKLNGEKINTAENYDNEHAEFAIIAPPAERAIFIIRVSVRAATDPWREGLLPRLCTCPDTPTPMHLPRLCTCPDTPMHLPVSLAPLLAVLVSQC